MGIEKPKARINVKIGQAVRVISGPFREFVGVVQDIIEEKQKIRVAVSMFGRETPVELEFGQVEKMD
jgi:transcriptional antiterminator NusG